MHASYPDIFAIFLLLAGASAAVIGGLILGWEIFAAWRRTRDRMLRSNRLG